MLQLVPPVAGDEGLGGGLLREADLAPLLEVFAAVLLLVWAEHGDQAVVAGLLQPLVAAVARLLLHALHHLLRHQAHAALARPLHTAVRKPLNITHLTRLHLESLKSPEAGSSLAPGQLGGGGGGGLVHEVGAGRGEAQLQPLVVRHRDLGAGGRGHYNSAFYHHHETQDKCNYQR